jgi:hypothetical protein
MQPLIANTMVYLLLNFLFSAGVIKITNHEL